MQRKLRNVTWDDLTIEWDNIDLKIVYEDWLWLLSGTIRPLMISKFGDMFFQRQNGYVFFLNTMEGSIVEICVSEVEFEAFINQANNIEKYLFSDLIYELVNSNRIPKENECYSFKIPPVLGGKIEPDNVSIMSLQVSVSLSGQLHRQLKDMPEGTRITSFKFIEKPK